MDLVFDIETDDLQATLIHCIVAQDADSEEIFRFPPDKLQEGYDFLLTADRLIGHNIIGFDIPLVEKKLVYTYEGTHIILLMNFICFFGFLLASYLYVVKN